ncbi:aldo/keto reductase [Microbacterium sp. AK031]|nr:aldo/keto reductase [Microbacterium sp. AK031]MCS3844861.1 aryl-alcohol dehydrogenase-like predicted oxidoreductase [Microbacterium sp. AK031]
MLAWLLAHGIRPILGGSKVEQLDAAMDAALFALTPEEVDAMDAPA